MTIAYWCILLAALLPYVFVSFAKVLAPGYNHATPREYCESLTGWRKRAYWAQLNGFEAFPAFAVAVLIAQHSFVEQPTIDTLAIIFILARVLHGICYIFDKNLLRTLVWTIGFACTIALFLVAA